MPAYKATGTALVGSSADALQPAWPAHVTGDYAILVIASDGNARGLTDAQGFAQLATVATGTSTGVRLSFYGCRAISGAMTAPTIASGGNNVTAYIVTFEDVNEATPVDVTASDVVAAGSESTSVSVPGATTTVAGCLIVAGVAYDTDTVTPQASAWANGALTGVAERGDSATTNGNGGGGAVATGAQASAGAYGATTATLATTSQQARISVALRPAAASYTVGGTVTIGETGAAAANGGSVQIIADNGDGTFDLVATASIAGGAGGFTASVPDNTRDYFAKYDDGTHRGVSALGTPV